MPRHKTIKMVVRGKTVDIDCGMAPVIKWLNSFPSVETTACCEGEGEEIVSQAPYVLFFVDDPVDLHSIICEIDREIDPDTIVTYANCLVDRLGQRIRYKIKWKNNGQFRLWKSVMFK